MSRMSIVLVGVATAVVCIAACAKKDQTPPPATTPTTSAQPYGSAQPGHQPGYGQPGQPGYGQPGQPGQPGQLSVPGPLALPCTSDSNCITHKCNTQYGKCTYPCQSDNDCIQGSKCFLAAGQLAGCIAGAPGQ